MRLSQRGASLILILSVVAIVSVALLAPDRHDNLQRWLHANPELLTATDREALRIWLSTHFVQTGLLQGFELQQLGKHLPSLIVVDGAMPGVFEDLTWNAAFDPEFDTVFLHMNFVRLILDPQSRGKYDDLILFIILHELGHRFYHHDRAQMNESHAPHADSASPSAQAELQADEYAQNQLMHLLAPDESARKNHDAIAERLNALVLDLLLENVSGRANFQLAAPSASHPLLLERCSKLLAAVSRSRLLSDEARARQATFARWLAAAASDARGHLAGEVTPPDGAAFSTGCSTSEGPVFLLEDGRLAMLPAGEMERMRRWVPGTVPVFTRAVARGSPLQGVSKLQLRSGSFIWPWDGHIYLLRPYGRLSVASQTSNWSFLPHSTLTPLSGKAVVGVFAVPEFNATFIVAVDPDTAYMYKLVQESSSSRLDPIAILNGAPPYDAMPPFHFLGFH